MASGPDPITAGGYDTVVLMAMDFPSYVAGGFATAWADPDFSSRITNFVSAGGKLIIYSSEMTSATAFASFLYPFTIDTPGQTGAFAGTLTNVVDPVTLVDNDDLSDDRVAQPDYINLPAITTATDAVGDLTVMTSKNSHWYVDLFGVNVNGIGGPGHTYAFYPDPADTPGNPPATFGLIIFNGLDIDYTSNTVPNNANGAGALSMLWYRELVGANIGPGANVNGLDLSPDTATNVIGTTHTLTATVTNTQTSARIPGVQVTFTITAGPNIGLTGSATTDAVGQATFSYSSSLLGIDTIEASIPNSIPGAPAITTTATKEWIPVPINQVPEVPLGTIVAFAAICVGFGSFAAKGKIRKFLP
jgi:hypothetical protein